MKVTNILRKDHRLVSGMMMTLEMSPRVNGMLRKSLFNQIRHQLTVHAQAEEDVFYPAVRNLAFGQSDRLLNDAYREHEKVRRLLNDISNLDPLSNQFDKKIQDLKRTIHQHVEEEEGKIFPMLERQWTVEQLRRVGQRLHARKCDLNKEMAAA